MPSRRARHVEIEQARRMARKYHIPTTRHQRRAEASDPEPPGTVDEKAKNDVLDDEKSA
jgi:hypothetical protein